jgi:N-methylhydantoinase B/oxoprolinase/acetone carboxylase alpha subunit
MTNSRLTDPEVLEFRFPVRLESYEIRQGSGGAGRWHGGDGGVRRVRFLEAMTASILSNGRMHGALAWPAARAAQVGINRVVRADGRVEDAGPHRAAPRCCPAMCSRFTRRAGAGLDDAARKLPRGAFFRLHPRHAEPSAVGRHDVAGALCGTRGGV